MIHRIKLALLTTSLLSITSVTQAQLLETISVTGQRQEQNLEKLADNTSVVSQEELQRIAHTHINESLARVPGTWISRGNGQEHLTAIRSPVLTGAGACGAFLMAEDGLPIRAAGFCNLNQLFEVNSAQAQRIEVLRGPGSALYGSNAVHGIINVITPPAPKERALNFSLDAGPHDYQRARVDLAQAIGAHAVRLQVNGSRDGGYKNDSGYDQQKVNLAHYFERDGLKVKNHLSYTNLNQETAGFVEGRDAYKDEFEKRNNPNPEAFRDARSWRFYSQIDVELGDGSLRVRPYMRDADMSFLQHFLPWRPLEENGVRSAGVQLSYQQELGALRWQAGLDVESSEGYLREIQADFFAPHLPAGVHYDYSVDAEIISPYVSLNWQLNDATRIDANLRFDMSEYDYVNNTGVQSACAPTVTNCRFTPPADRKDDFDAFSPSLGLIHTFSDSLTAYAKISQGFRAPQATELYRLQAGQQLSDLDNERLDSIELGLRGRNGGFQWAANVFTMKKKDFIFQDSDRLNISGGASKHEGLELEFQQAFTKDLLLAFSGSYASHKYDNSIDLRGGGGDINGKYIDTAPRYSTNTRLIWQASSAVNAELEWFRLGSYFQEPQNNVKYGGHDLVNLRVSLTLNEQWSVAARASNLLDTEYAERADFAFGDNRYFVGEPRSVYFTVSGSF